MNPIDIPFTLTTMGFADQVLQLRRKNKTVEEVVRALGRSELEVLAAHRMFDIPTDRELLGPAQTKVEVLAGVDKGAHAPFNPRATRSTAPTILSGAPKIRADETLVKGA